MTQKVDRGKLRNIDTAPARYDPILRDYDAEDAAALEADRSPRTRVGRYERFGFKRVTDRDAIYHEIFARIRDEWDRRRMIADLPSGHRPAHFDVLMDGGNPATTFDETTLGNSHLEDGTALGTMTSSLRARRNLRHIMHVAKTFSRACEARGVDYREHKDKMLRVKTNVPWNWTLGRPERPGDPSSHVIHLVGESFDHAPVPAGKAWAVIPWPDKKKRKKGAMIDLLAPPKYKPTDEVPF